MFEFIKRRRERHATSAAEYDAEASKIADELKRLELTLAQNPRDGECQKRLMLAYNRALKIYAKSLAHRQGIDELFVKMDELRNIIRKSL